MSCREGKVKNRRMREKKGAKSAGTCECEKLWREIEPGECRWPVRGRLSDRWLALFRINYLRKAARSGALLAASAAPQPGQNRVRAFRDLSLSRALSNTPSQKRHFGFFIFFLTFFTRQKWAPFFFFDFFLSFRQFVWFKAEKSRE